MGVHISRGDSRKLTATVSGEFDFETSRRLLLGVKQGWAAGCDGGVDVVLRDVTTATSCSIGTLMLISELAGKQFRIHLDTCGSEVQGLFSSGMLDRFFPPEVLAGCRDCLDRQAHKCHSDATLAA